MVNYAGIVMQMERSYQLIQSQLKRISFFYIYIFTIIRNGSSVIIIIIIIIKE